MFYKSNTSAWKKVRAVIIVTLVWYNDYGPDLFYLFVLSMVCGGKVPVVILVARRRMSTTRIALQYHGGIPGEPAVKGIHSTRPRQ